MSKPLLALVAGVLGGCATPYAPNSFWNDGGFTETEVQPGVYMVRFNGNEFSSEERTADFAMLRAAELCLSKDSAYMLLGDVATSTVPTGVIPGSSRTTSTASAYGTGNSATAVGSSYTTTTPATTLYSPRSGLTVRCVPTNGDGAWDANFLANAMRTKYKIKPK